jgi:hypothetical protein
MYCITESYPRTEGGVTWGVVVQMGGRCPILAIALLMLLDTDGDLGLLFPSIRVAFLS